MAARMTETICAKSKLGHSLSQISELTGLTSDEVKERLGQATGLTPEALSSILHMKQRGLSLELISQELDVEHEVLEQFLPPVIKKTVETHALADQDPYEISLSQRASTLSSPDHCKTNSRSPTTTEEAKQLPAKKRPEPQHTPTFFYSCEFNTNKLRRVNLLTRKQSFHKVPSYQFRYGRCWSELPGGSLLLTGGGPSDVTKIDTLREYAVSSLPPMHTARYDHAAVYHSQYLYVLGGLYRGVLSECERYSCAENRWEVLPALPAGGGSMSGVEVENSLYALGGFAERALDTVQKLSLDSLTWELMQLKLPRAAIRIPCFKIGTQVYLVIGKTLYSFTPLQVKPIKTLAVAMNCLASYYSKGTLYYENGGGIRRSILGELTSL
jgi:hypothetical protein